MSSQPRAVSSATTDLAAQPNPADPLSALAPVDLETLQASASLQARRDRKYLIPATTLSQLWDRLPEGTRVLEIDGVRSHRYRSTYYDTDAMTSYLQAARARRRRFKVRTRCYLDQGGIWLEVKTRTARGGTLKHRRLRAGDPIGPAGVEQEALDRADLDFIREVLTEHRLTVDVRDLDPVLEVGYRRRTLLLPGPVTARATIDTGIWMSEPGGTPTVLTGHAIVETKTAAPAAPSALDRILRNQFGLRPQPLSKYGVGRATLSPGLPQHRWHRLMPGLQAAHPSTPEHPDTPTHTSTLQQRKDLP